MVGEQHATDHKEEVHHQAAIVHGLGKQGAGGRLEIVSKASVRIHKHKGRHEQGEHVHRNNVNRANCSNAVNKLKLVEVGLFGAVNLEQHSSVGNWRETVQQLAQVRWLALGRGEGFHQQGEHHKYRGNGENCPVDK